jgi:hypothetical protein
MEIKTIFIEPRKTYFMHADVNGLKKDIECKLSEYTGKYSYSVSSIDGAIGFSANEDILDDIYNRIVPMCEEYFKEYNKHFAYQKKGEVFKSGWIDTMVDELSRRLDFGLPQEKDKVIEIIKMSTFMYEYLFHNKRVIENYLYYWAENIAKEYQKKLVEKYAKKYIDKKEINNVKHS